MIGDVVVSKLTNSAINFNSTEVEYLMLEQLKRLYVNNLYLKQHMETECHVKFYEKLRI